MPLHLRIFKIRHPHKLLAFVKEMLQSINAGDPDLSFLVALLSSFVLIVMPENDDFRQAIVHERSKSSLIFALQCVVVLVA